VYWIRISCTQAITHLTRSHNLNHHIKTRWPRSNLVYWVQSIKSECERPWSGGLDWCPHESQAVIAWVPRNPNPMVHFYMLWYCHVFWLLEMPQEENGRKPKSDIDKFVWSNHKSWVPRPLLSMHVRMGDKACEMRVVEFEEYMQLADRIRSHFPNLNNIWLSTEMQVLLLLLHLFWIFQPSYSSVLIIIEFIWFRKW